MIFNGIDLTPYFRIKDIRGRGLSQRRVNTIPVTGMDGEYIDSVETPAKLLEIDIKIISKNLRETIDYLNDILTTDMPVPIIFPDEPDKTYYGIVENSEETGEKVHLGHHDASIYIRRSDPYKYGQELTQEFTQDSAIVENPGTAPAKPIFELTAKQPVTFAMVSDGERYNMVGRPADVDEQVVEEKVTLLDEIGDTLDQWDTPSGSTGSFIKGSLGIQVQSYGTGTGWHGPRLITEVDPSEDFEIEFYVNVRSETPERTFRISTNYYDENMNELGLLRLWDNSDRILRKTVEARVGPYVGDFVNYPISSRNYDMRTQRVWNGLLRVSRINNIYFFYVARITQAGRHVDTLTTAFPDVKKEYAGLLKFIRIDIAKYGNTQQANEVGINRITVKKYNQITVDQTPYIAHEGDVFTFDHINNELLLNGEDVKRLKDFGGEYFTLPKGFTTLTVLPENAFDTKIRFKPRYR